MSFPYSKRDLSGTTETPEQSSDAGGGSTGLSLPVFKRETPVKSRGKGKLVAREFNTGNVLKSTVPIDVSKFLLPTPCCNRAMKSMHRDDDHITVLCAFQSYTVMSTTSPCYVHAP